MDSQRRRQREREREREREGEREREKTQSLNHFWVQQWVRCAIHASQQLTSPIRFPVFKTTAGALCRTTGMAETMSKLFVMAGITRSKIVFKY